MRLVALTLSILSMAEPTQARMVQDSTLERALAVAIADSLPDLDYPWQLEWDPFGVYGSRDVRWHLAPPEPYPADGLAPGVTRRTGWISINGRSASVAVCGNDDRVGAMMLETSDIWLEDGDLTSELAEIGVTSTLLEQRDRAPIFDAPGGDDLPDHYVQIITAHPAYRRMRLVRTGHEPALLTSTYVCTGPGTRSATRCDMHWTVQYRIEAAARPDACVAPAEPIAVSLD